MKFSYKTMFLVASLSGVSHLSSAGALYTITAEDAEGAYIDTYECTESMGSGGNLEEAGIDYEGKCEGAGAKVEIGGTHKYQKYLKFKTKPDYLDNFKTRTELAVTDTYFPFKEKFYIGFRLMVPEGVDVTDDFFYLMQLWQCSPASPIAGIRMKRGESHTINFMTRGDFREGSMAEFELVPNLWHRFVMKVVVNPRNGEGEFAVWKDENGTPIEIRESFGFFNVGTCSEGVRPPQHFRVKFGIYKGNEPGRNFETRFDDIRIGDTYSSVKPW